MHVSAHAWNRPERVMCQSAVQRGREQRDRVPRNTNDCARSIQGDRAWSQPYSTSNSDPFTHRHRWDGSQSRGRPANSLMASACGPSSCRNRHARGWPCLE